MHTSISSDRFSLRNRVLKGGRRFKKQSLLVSEWVNKRTLFTFANHTCTKSTVLASSKKMDAGTAQKNWELENNIATVDPAQDHVYFYDAAQDKENVALKPWKNE